MFYFIGIFSQCRRISRVIHSRIMGRFLVGLHHVHHSRVRKLLEGDAEKNNYNCPVDKLSQKEN